MLIKTIIKTLIILAVIFAGYAFYSKMEAAKAKSISTHYANLVKNRLSYISLAKLDPKSDNFEIEKSDLVGIIRETNKIGLENPLNSKEKDIFTRQNVVLQKVFATKTYEDGVAVIKSPESVKLLADQTALIADLAAQMTWLRALPLLRLP